MVILSQQTNVAAGTDHANKQPNVKRKSSKYGAGSSGGESDQSVLMHLINQLSVGMDLTKVCDDRH